MPSSTDIRDVSGWSVLSVAGDLDIYAAPRLRGELVDLIAAGTHRLVVDTGGVTFIDSTGLGVLIGALKRVRAADGELRVVASGEPVVRMLRVTGLHRVFSTFATLDEAVADRG